jgi:hypothetical protein
MGKEARQAMETCRAWSIIDVKLLKRDNENLKTLPSQKSITEKK